MPYDFNDLGKTDPLQTFLDEIEKAGLGRPDILGTGEIERFSTPDDKPGDKAGWAVLYLDRDFAAGAFGSWRNGGSHTWASDKSPVSIQRMAEAKKKGEEERVKRHEEARIKSSALWDKSPQADKNHPYLKSKGVNPYGIRQNGNKLLVPMMDSKGVLHSLQEIDPHGDKKNFPGGAVKGHFHTIPGRTETIYLCEGYATGATIHEATRAQVVVAFNRNNLVAVAPLLKGRVIVAADNDHQTNGNPGLKAAKETGLPFVFPEGIKGTDFNDLQAEKGLDAVRSLLRPPLNKFDRRLIRSESLFSAFQESLNLSFRIKGILPESSGLVLIYGAPGSYKSFMALDMALSIATGADWHKSQVQLCPVLYTAAEGQSGVLKRIEAWRIHHKVDISSFSLLPMPCLIDNPGELQDFIQMVQTIKPRVIFLDTLARSMLGDENSTLDMGKVVIACDRIRLETGAMVVLIHHTGKDESKGARGAIALTGATDTAFKVVKTKKYRQCVLICERQKDYDPFQPMFFDMELVDTGYKNIDGEAVTSLVPVYDPNVKTATKKENSSLRGGPAIAYKALIEAAKEFGVIPPDSVKDKMGSYLPGDKVVAVESWRTMAYRIGISDGDTQQAKKKAFNRAKEILTDKGLIGSFDGYYWMDK